MPTCGTRFELEHIAHADDHWAQFGPGAVGVGWELALLGLARHLSTGEAAIAAGQDPAEATAAAKRTLAFYTGAAPGG